MRETLSQRQLGSTGPHTHLSSETAASACFIFVHYAFMLTAVTGVQERACGCYPTSSLYVISASYFGSPSLSSPT